MKIELLNDKVFLNNQGFKKEIHPFWLRERVNGETYVDKNTQQRFITLIDILYEKKIPLLISSNFQLDEILSSMSLSEPFKRTKSRIYELTSPDINIV